MVVVVLGMSEPARTRVRAAADRSLLRARSNRHSGTPAQGSRARAAAALGSACDDPRDAFLGPQESIPIEGAVGRVAAESLAAYPPGIPNVFPGERLTAQTLGYIKRTLDQSGTVAASAIP